MWEVDYPADGETCQGLQSDGSCKSISIPKCVDRNVYCNAVAFPANATIAKLPVDGNIQKLGAVLKFTCPIAYWFFNYSIPKNLISYYYSNNINVTTLTCNTHG